MAPWLLVVLVRSLLRTSKTTTCRHQSRKIGWLVCEVQEGSKYLQWSLESDLSCDCSQKGQKKDKIQTTLIDLSSTLLSCEDLLVRMSVSWCLWCSVCRYWVELRNTNKYQQLPTAKSNIWAKANWIICILLLLVHVEIFILLLLLGGRVWDILDSKRNYKLESNQIDKN